MPARSKLIDGSAALIETVTRLSIDDKPGHSPLDDMTIDDGFYRVVQYENDGNEPDALSDDYKYTGITMKSAQQPNPGIEWMFTRKWGLLENRFTIAPKVSPNSDRHFGRSVGTVEVRKTSKAGYIA
ncbi:hypothetical protein FRC08_012570 [Ceratobasidium sp. 394]|nr:hypothetical protein FRC08_012570 [Ceratobasidium sp. 394]